MQYHKRILTLAHRILPNDTDDPVKEYTIYMFEIGETETLIGVFDGVCIDISDPDEFAKHAAISYKTRYFYRVDRTVAQSLQSY